MLGDFISQDDFKEILQCCSFGVLTVLMLLLGYRHVSAALVKLQKTLKESLEQPWLGSIQ